MTNRIHLSQDDREILEVMFREHLPGVEVWAYGSRVNGRSFEGSDLDLVLRAPDLKEIPNDQLAKFKDAVYESNIPFLVDARDWTRLPKRFQKEIESEKQILASFDDIPSLSEQTTITQKRLRFRDSISWSERQLADLTENFDAVRVPVKKADRSPGPFPYYGASGVIDFVNQHLFDGDYLLVAEDGENLRTRKTPISFLAKGKFWVNNHAHILRANEEADTRFLMYAVSLTDISGYLTGTTIPKLTQRNLARVTIKVPPLKEQRAIVRILGALDDKIELNHRLSETLEETLQALFKSWFVNFDPVREKEEKYQNGSPIHISRLFPDRLIATKFGLIPEGWRKTELAEIATITRGTSYRSAELQESTVALVSLKSFKLGGGYRATGLKPYTGKFKPEQVIEPNELVIAQTDVTQAAEVVGKPAIVPKNDKFETLVASLDVGIIRPLVDQVSTTFLRGICMTDRFQAHIRANCTGTTVLHLNKSAFPSYEIFLPRKAILKTFNHFSVPLTIRILELNSESENLVQIRDALLPKLITGEIRVCDAERIVKSAI